MLRRNEIYSSIIHQINIDGSEDILEHQLANRINTSLLEPLAEYQLSLPLAVVLALPISQILNASYKQQCLPSIWKFANVSPLPKVKLVQDLKRELRPISLTPIISKVAEDFVIKDYVKPAILKIIDPNQ